MGLFAVWSEQGSSRSPGDVVRLLVDGLPFEPDDTLSHRLTTPEGSFGCVLFGATTPLSRLDDQFFAGPAGFCVMSGHAWVADGSRPNLCGARDILAEPLDPRRNGAFCAVTVATSGELRGITDLHGLHHLYYAETHDRLVVSNRVGITAALANRCEPDTRAALWLAATGYRIGERTSFAGVRALAQGSTLRGFRGRVNEAPRSESVLNVAGSARGYPAAREEIDPLIDAGVDEAIAAVQLAFRDTETISLGVSGGKDSRVLLALVLSAGLADRVRLTTRGRPDHPDVVVGREVARICGLPWGGSPPAAIRFTPTWPADDFFERVARFTTLTEGMLGAWDLVEPAEGARRVTMTGHLGEVLKAFAKRPFDPDELDVVELVQLQSPFDPMGLLRSEAVAELRSELTMQLLDLRAATELEIADLPDAFYYRNRVPNWLGGIVQTFDPSLTQLMPLGSVSLTRAAFRMAAAERKQELLHFQILRRLRPDLLSTPFAGQSWHPALAEYLPEGSVPAPVTLPPGSKLPMVGSWQFTWNRNPALRAMVSEVIEEERAIPLWDHVDRRALLSSLRERELGLMPLISLMGLLPSVLFQSGRGVSGRRDPSTARRADRARRMLTFRGSLDGMSGAGVLAFRREPSASGSEVKLASTGPVVLSGWLRCPEFPGAGVGVEIVGPSGSVVASVAANLPRAPLALQRVGKREDLRGRVGRRLLGVVGRHQERLTGEDDGKHAFVLELRAEDLLEAAGVEPMVFSVRASDSNFVLPCGRIRMLRG